MLPISRKLQFIPFRGQTYGTRVLIRIISNKEQNKIINKILLMDFSGKRILIVDDEEDLCEILQYNLTNSGFITDVAHSSEEALKKPLHNYDLFLLDVMMGSMSGFRLAEKI